MPLCPYCHTVVSQDTRFCPECGKPLIRSQRGQATTSVSQKERKATGLEGQVAGIKGDLRSWGFGLIVIGVIHFVFSEFLDPVWGGVLIAIGISCLFIRQRGMYIVIGTALILVGIMNIFVGGLGGWTIYGVFQIGFGIYQIHKFRKYGRISAGYDKALESNPDSIDAYWERGDAYAEVGDHSKAIADYTRAIELEPRHALAYFNRAYAYGDIGEYDKAIADHSKVIELDPNDAQAYYNRGLDYLNKGEIAEAVSDLEKCVELSTDPDLTKDARQALDEIESSMRR